MSHSQFRCTEAYTETCMVLRTGSAASGMGACINSRSTTVIHVTNDHQINYNDFNEPFAVSPFRTEPDTHPEGGPVVLGRHATTSF